MLEFLNTPISQLFKSKQQPVPTGLKSCGQEFSSLIKLASISGASSPKAAMSLFSQSSALAIPVTHIVSLFSALEPVILENGTDKITDHELLSLLKEPSPYFTKELLFTTLGIEYLVTGNAFFGMFGNFKRPPIEIMPFSVSCIQEMQGRYLIEALNVINTHGEGTYKNTIEKNRLIYRNGELREITHLHGYSAKNNSLMLGDSLLVSASREIRQHILGNDHNSSLLSRGGRPSLIFNLKDSYMDDKAFADAKNRILSEYSGADNAGRVGVVSNDELEIKELAISNRDMDFVNLQKMASETVARFYKFPLLLLSSNPSYNNFKEAKLALYDDAVLPLASTIFSFLQKSLFPRYGLDPARYQLWYDEDAITALDVRRRETLAFRREMNLETTNELRASIDREPIPGGDYLFANAGMFPIGQDVATDEKQIQLKDNRNYEIEHKAIDEIAFKYAPKFEKALAEQQKLIFDALEAGVTDYAAILEKSDKLEAAIAEMYVKSANNGAENVVVITKALSEIIALSILEYLKEEQVILTEKSLINEATTIKITSIVYDAIDNGLTIAEIQTKIIDSGTFSAERALRISRTIAGTSQSIGQQLGAKSAGATKKMWVTSGFEVRTEHQNRSGETVDINGSFSRQFAGGARPRYPCDQIAAAGDRINCRCSMVFTKDRTQS